MPSCFLDCAVLDIKLLPAEESISVSRIAMDRQRACLSPLPKNVLRDPDDSRSFSGHCIFVHFHRQTIQRAVGLGGTLPKFSIVAQRGTLGKLDLLT